MSIYGIRKAIQSVEKEFHEIDYAFSKEEIRLHGSNVFILTENIVKELVYIYSYLLYKEHRKEKYSRLMFGQLISKLEYMSKIVKNNKDILESLNREYLVFNDEDNNIEKLRVCSRVRGKILHDHGMDIQDLEDYKKEIKEAILLSFEVLNDFKNKNIFPTIVAFDSVVSGTEEDLVYFRDEISIKMPIRLDAKDISGIKNNQWYIFRNSNMPLLIPVINKIHNLSSETIEPLIIDAKIDEGEPEYSKSYLDVVGEGKISISRAKTFIGRLATNDIQFTNRSISRRHCLVEVIDKYVYVVDLDSKFGTYVNDIRAVSRERTLLRDGDEIIIGKGIERVRIIYIAEE